MNSSTIVDKVTEALRDRDCAGQGMVVAVSGGPDSVALLRALLSCEASVRPSHIVVAHLNHQLRGAESDADEVCVRHLITDLQKSAACRLELCIERVDVRGAADADKANLESTARSVRYDWLVRVAGEHDLQWIATGHTADDQAETVLHRLLRGAGLRGLRGIAPCREGSLDVSIIRPLLSVTREEILAYLRSLGQAFQEDSSNRDLGFTRNRLRHELLPLLKEKYNPAAAQILCRLAEQADELFDLIERQAQRTLEGVERPRARNTIILDRELLSTTPRYLVCEVFRLIWAREGWPQDAVGYEDWNRLAALARGEIRAIDLPGGLRAQLGERVVQVGPVS